MCKEEERGKERKGRKRKRKGKERKKKREREREKRRGKNTNTRGLFKSGEEEIAILGYKPLRTLKFNEIGRPVFLVLVFLFLFLFLFLLLLLFLFSFLFFVTIIPTPFPFPSPQQTLMLKLPLFPPPRIHHPRLCLSKMNFFNTTPSRNRTITPRKPIGASHKSRGITHEIWMFKVWCEEREGEREGGRRKGGGGGKEK